MVKQTLLTWILLLTFTIVSSIVSNSSIDYVVVAILTLSALKFLGVAFEFMNLKAAHNFWKVALAAYLVVFMGVVLILL